MPRRSRSLCIQRKKNLLKAKEAFAWWKKYKNDNNEGLSKITQVDFAEELYLSHGTIKRFFQPTGIDADNFQKICEKLGLNHLQISAPEPITEVPRKPVRYYAGEKRLDQINQLDDALKLNSHIAVSIPDLGGQGKTELVLKYIEEKIVKGETIFTGGCLFINLYNNIAQQIDEFFSRIESANLNITNWKKPPASKKVKDKIKWIYGEYVRTSASNPSPILLVFDDVDKFDQIEDYLPFDYPETFKVVITTRKQNLCPSFFKNFHLSCFSEEDCIDLFAKFINQERFIEEFRDQLAKLAFLVGYLPLAVELECSYIQKRMIKQNYKNTPEVNSSINKKLERLILALQKPQPIPSILTSIDSGLGLTTGLNNNPSRRRQLQENGIIALFNVTWNILSDQTKIIAYVSCLFEKAPVDIDFWTSDLPSAQNREIIEGLIYKELNEYSFCKINFSDELLFHKIIRSFVLHQGRLMEETDFIEESLIKNLVGKFVERERQQNENNHSLSPEKIRLWELFSQRLLKINPWTLLPTSGANSVLELYLIRICSMMFAANDRREHEIANIRKLAKSQGKEIGDYKQQAISCVSQSHVFLASRQYHKAIESLLNARQIILDENEKDYLYLEYLCGELGRASKLYALIGDGNQEMVTQQNLDKLDRKLISQSINWYREAVAYAYKNNKNESDPSFPDAYIEIAELLRILDCRIKAKKYAKRALHLARYTKNPKNFEEIGKRIVVILGTMYFEEGNRQAAKRIFRELMSSCKEEISKVESILCIARVYCESGINRRYKQDLLRSRRYLILGCERYENRSGKDDVVYQESLAVLQRVNIHIVELDITK